MEKAIVIPIDNQDGSHSLADYLAKIPSTIRMRIKPSFLRDKSDSPIGSHVIIPVRLLSSIRGLTTSTVTIQVEKFYGTNNEAKCWLGGAADTREHAVALLSAKFDNPEKPSAYSYYVSQGFGYRQVMPKATQPTAAPDYADEKTREERNFYVSLILPEDAPGYIEHWITCRRRATNMQFRGEIKGTVYSKKKGLRILAEHNNKFSGGPSDTDPESDASISVTDTTTNQTN